MNYNKIDNKEFFNIRIPWDRNTYLGFIISVIICSIFIFLTSFFNMKQPTLYEPKSNVIPIELLSFGEGDGTGVSKGNLTAEGEAHKGLLPANQLEDAKIASNGKISATTKLNPEDANVIPSKNLSIAAKSDPNASGSDRENIGNPKGSEQGRGLGDKGYGAGLGMGLGDIEWGGGGNRIVLQKKIPVYPPGVNTSGTIRIKFTVLPDGTVDKMIPLEKADPRLERAAMDALRQWRFNPIKENIVMEGIITMAFKLR
ncbi:MAG TPA: energy transducer TonB [Bacteroidota bacterium]|nr:energy transducer TonB [Bacteroidota bacterium]